MMFIDDDQSVEAGFLDEGRVLNGQAANKVGMPKGSDDLKCDLYMLIAAEGQLLNRDAPKGCEGGLEGGYFLMAKL